MKIVAHTVGHIIHEDICFNLSRILSLSDIRMD